MTSGPQLDDKTPKQRFGSCVLVPVAGKCATPNQTDSPKGNWERKE